MRVIVLKDDGTFYKTAAFAIHYDGWKTEFFVINDKREFERIYEYTQDKSKVEKRVFILDADINQVDFVATDECEGYKFFVNNKKLLDRIRKGEKNIFTPDEMSGFESYIYSENYDIIVEDNKTCHKKYFIVNENDIVACFDNNVSNDVIKELAKIKPIYAVFRDSVFENDAANINCEQLFKSISPSTTIKVL